MHELRERDRFGSSRKKSRILELIERYWNQIEGDFAFYLHVDARDFIRGTRPWSQFLNYCHRVAQEEGGQLWAAQLTDPRYWDEIKAKADEMRKKGPGRPPLEGHNSTVKALYMVANQLRMLLQAKGIDIGFIDGPAGPLELMEEQHTQASLSLVDIALGYKEVS